MYRYLHVQAQPIMTSLAAAMLRGGSFVIPPRLRLQPSISLWALWANLATEARPCVQGYLSTGVYGAVALVRCHYHQLHSSF